MKESLGWQQLYISPRMDAVIRHVALYAKFGEKMLAVSLANNAIHLWNISEGDANFGAKIGRKFSIFIYFYLTFLFKLPKI